MPGVKLIAQCSVLKICLEENVSYDKTTDERKDRHTLIKINWYKLINKGCLSKVSIKSQGSLCIVLETRWSFCSSRSSLARAKVCAKVTFHSQYRYAEPNMFWLQYPGNLSHNGKLLVLRKTVGSFILNFYMRTARCKF